MCWATYHISTLRQIVYLCLTNNFISMNTFIFAVLMCMVYLFNLLCMIWVSITMRLPQFHLKNVDLCEVTPGAGLSPSLSPPPVACVCMSVFSNLCCGGMGQVIRVLSLVSGCSSSASADISGVRLHWQDFLSTSPPGLTCKVGKPVCFGCCC